VHKASCSMEKKFELSSFGYEVVIGKFANQADGAAWFKHGGTVVLSTAVSAPTAEFPGFLPLSVEYREQFSAAGKIPGGYFKREGKYTDKEVLTARLVDRAIRPLFPSTFFNQIQVLTTVYSVDKEHMPSVISLISASIALTISKIPFLGPVGAVEVARVDGKWVINPTMSQAMTSDVKVIVAGTEEGICMLEGCTVALSEKDLLDVIFMAHDKIKEQVAWQKEIAAAVGVQKEEQKDTFDWALWEQRANEFFSLDLLNSVCKEDKNERYDAVDKAKADFLAKYADEIKEKEINEKQVDYVFHNAFRNRVTDWIFEKGQRVDGRNFTQVRKVTTEVGVLPYTHGSALFKRGNTQALVTATLGSGQDEQRIEMLMGEEVEKNFMLHYNFPPFSVGEVRPMRGPGRREVGHGYLAASALKHQLPAKADFPYTIRVVADILESDGSSSMATVCGSTMALMNAGVPITAMVSGVAMGLLKNSKGQFQAITDISGFEDEFGWMDFKVAGTEQGVTAIQMDIKNKAGLPKEVFEKALSQARDGRQFILNEMKSVLAAPSDLSPLVPKIISFKVAPDKIGAIIGTGGKIIREIIEKTGTTIDIEDDGTVNIFGGPDANIDLAINWVKTLAGQIEPGALYQGRVKRLADFGIFVELVPGLDGLLHISQIPKNLQRNLSDSYKIGQELLVEVGDYDPVNGRISLRLVNKE